MAMKEPTSPSVCKTKDATAAVLVHAKGLLALIPPNLALDPEEFEDLECLLGAALSRVESIRRGLFTVENCPRPPSDMSEKQLRVALRHFQPTPEQIAEFERFNRGPTRADKRRLRELTKRRERLEKKVKSIDEKIREIRPLVDEGARRDAKAGAKLSALDHAVREMAKRGLKPAEISQSLRQMFGVSVKSARADTTVLGIPFVLGKLEGIDDVDGFSSESLSEKAINTRLFRLRAKGFKQPISPTAKKRRTKT